MKIFIAGLSINITDTDLLDLFAEYGEINSARVIKDRETGRTKGFGFVDLEDDQAGKKAIEDLDGAEYDGKRIFVSEAKPKEEGNRRNNNQGFDRNRRTSRY